MSANRSYRPSRWIQKLVEEVNFLNTKIKRYGGDIRGPACYDLERKRALMFVLTQLAEYAYKHAEDREWAERICKIVPSDAFLQELYEVKTRDSERRGAAEVAESNSTVEFASVEKNLEI